MGASHGRRLRNRLMASSTKIRSQTLSGITEIKLLIGHDMENGRNRDPVSGQLIPAHFVQEIDIELNGMTVVAMKLGGSMAKNPFFTFRLKSLRDGDKLVARWTDNRGGSDSAETIIGAASEN